MTFYGIDRQAMQEFRQEVRAALEQQETPLWLWLTQRVALTAFMAYTTFHAARVWGHHGITVKGLLAGSVVFMWATCVRLWRERHRALGVQPVQARAPTEFQESATPARSTAGRMDPMQMVRVGRRVKWARMACGAALGACLAYAAHGSRLEWLLSALIGGLVFHGIGRATNRLIYHKLFARRVQGDR